MGGIVCTCNIAFEGGHGSAMMATVLYSEQVTSEMRNCHADDNNLHANFLFTEVTLQSMENEQSNCK
jgi:hypothetical protein